MESGNIKLFKVVLFFQIVLIIFLIFFLSIYLNRYFEFKDKLVKLDNKMKDKDIKYNLDDLDKELDFYTNIETNLERLYDDYSSNIALLEKNIQENKTDVKIAYLTFDDGPYSLTERYLDILKQNDVRATFFVLGKKGFDDTYKRIVNEGHTLANHTYYHNISSGLYGSVENFMTQVIDLEKYLVDITGYKTSIVRFPGGSSTAGQLKNQLIDSLHNKGYKYVDWTCETGDGSSAKLAQKGTYQWFIDTLQDQKIMILLMHDYNYSTYNDLPKIIDYLKKNNYLLLPLHNKSVMLK